MPHLHRLLLPLCSLLAAGALAGPLQDAEAQRSRGQPAQALALIERALAAQPADAELRFARGNLLMELNRQPEAEAVFRALTQEFPELPGPYNNLAVLAGGRGEWPQARWALEEALRLQPQHPQARENLAEVYLQLAAAMLREIPLAWRDGAVTRRLAAVESLLNQPHAGQPARQPAAPARP